jgi:hypothetical protein
MLEQPSKGCSEHSGIFLFEYAQDVAVGTNHNELILKAAKKIYVI